MLPFGSVDLLANHIRQLTSSCSSMAAYGSSLHLSRCITFCLHYHSLRLSVSFFVNGQQILLFPGKMYAQQILFKYRAN